MFKLVIFILVTLASCYYSFIYEPNNLEINHYKRSYLNQSQKIKIAHITDLHTKGLGSVEKKVIESLSKENPDYIFITGDIATPGGTIEGYRAVLSQFKAAKGVYFVLGNWEYWEPIEKLNEILKDLNITLLKNELIAVDTGLNLIGFDDIEGSPDKNLIDQANPDILNIALFHSPEFFELEMKDIQLSLAGHSHGGQVKLPFYGPIWTPRGTGKYVEGWYKKGSNELYVSRGIGTSILPIRFNCRPELSYIEISF